MGCLHNLISEGKDGFKGRRVNIQSPGLQAGKESRGGMDLLLELAKSGNGPPGSQATCQGAQTAYESVRPSATLSKGPTGQGGGDFQVGNCPMPAHSSVP